MRFDARHNVTLGQNEHLIHAITMRPNRRVPTRQPTPELLETPAPSGKYPNFASYAKHAVDLVGTASRLGELMGFSTGTRISDWIRGRGGRPSISACLKLAELTNDSPLDVLVMAGYGEEAELLRKFGLDSADIPPSATPTLLQTKMKLLEAKTLFDAAMRKIEDM